MGALRIHTWLPTVISFEMGVGIFFFFCCLDVDFFLLVYFSNNRFLCANGRTPHQYMDPLSSWTAVYNTHVCKDIILSVWNSGYKVAGCSSLPQTWLTDSSYQVAIFPLSVTTEHLKIHEFNQGLLILRIFPT